MFRAPFKETQSRNPSADVVNTTVHLRARGNENLVRLYAGKRCSGNMKLDPVQTGTSSRKRALHRFVERRGLAICPDNAASPEREGTI